MPGNNCTVPTSNPRSLTPRCKISECNKSIKLVHNNIQGMLGKELFIELFLNSEDVNILCLTEHWLKNDQLMFSFNNHHLASSFNRENAIRGGSLILIQNGIKYKERTDIVTLSVERTIEIACIELEHLIVLSVYRPPNSSFDIFEKTMDVALSKIKCNKNVTVCGDFNVDLLVGSGNSSKLKSLFMCYNLGNLFLEPTRITETSATCIDNIYSNQRPKTKSIISKLDTDHLGQLAVFYTDDLVKTVKGDAQYVPLNEGRLERYRNNVITKLPNIVYYEDANLLYNSLFYLVKNEHDNVFTTKAIKKNHKMLFSDWATVGIYKSRQRLYELYEERCYNFGDSFRQYVRNYSKLFKRICTQAKSMYISNKISSSNNIVKTTWQIINNETGKTKQRNVEFKLNVSDRIVTQDVDVAESFEHFFSNIPVTVTRSLNSSPTLAESLLRQSMFECNVAFKFDHIDPVTILKSFKSLVIKKTADLDGLSVKTISSIVDHIAPHLACIFNKCVDEGLFPDLMKQSKVIPLFKSGSTDNPSNFRPISILPTLSKIFEKVMLNQLLAHFNINNLMHCKQFGFTRGRSTTEASVELIKYIYSAWEDSHDAIGVFCDLSKAFDCVCHKTLVRKLSHYGIKDAALKLLESYLSDRIQKVVVNGKRSSGSVVSMGVPQGSILGPFLFLVYINDLPLVVEDKHGIVLFADDTSLLFKVKRHSQTLDEVNIAISRVVEWFEANNLLLNENKTKCIRFSLPNVRHGVTDIFIKNERLNLEEKTLFLGVTLDSKLQWGPHLDRLAKKLSSAAYAVRRVRNVSDVDAARLVYFAYFHSLMSYGILLWGNAADANRIFVLQKRAVRGIYKLGPRESLRSRFKEINILTLASQFIYENLLYVKKNIHLFKKNSDVSKYNTRSRNKLVDNYSRLRKVKKSFMGQCIRFFNKVPIAIQEFPLYKFKKIIRQRLILKAYYTISDYLEDNNPWGSY